MFLWSLFISWLVSSPPMYFVMHSPLMSTEMSVKLSFFSWNWCLKLSTHKETRGKWKLVFLSAHAGSKTNKPWDTGHCISLLNINFIPEKAQTISCYCLIFLRKGLQTEENEFFPLIVSCMHACISVKWL